MIGPEAVSTPSPCAVQRRVAMIPPSRNLPGNCLLTHLPRREISHEMLLAEHDALRRILMEAGVDVFELQINGSCPDGTFAQDIAMRIDGTLVLSAPRFAGRKAELSEFVEHAPALLPCCRIVDPREIDPTATVEFGDVFKIGEKLLVGLSDRTNSAGFAVLERIAADEELEAVPIEVRGCLHLSTGTTPIGTNLMAVNPAWVDTATLSRCGIELLEVDGAEPWAANVLLLPSGELVGQAEYEKTISRLRSRGLTVRTLPFSEHNKAEGGLTCKVLRLD